MSLLYHVGIVLVVIWWLSYLDKCHPVLYFVSFIYLFMIHERYVMRLRRKLQFEERRQANQKRVLTDSETVRWLNYAIEKIWLICVEPIASQKILLPIIPWFLEKYKPWTAKKAEVQHLYLGRNPPVLTEIRVLRHSTDDDHLVLELGMNFLTADDMSAILSVKLRKRLGGIRPKMHLTGMHLEGKILVGVKFIRHWPFVSRVRVCFAEPPYFQMNVKPISTHGLDVTELPGIAGWLDKLLSIAFEETLVEPNMVVVDMEKFVSPQAENWFSVNVKEPIAYAIVEIIEATDMKPSDLNGLADPYVKGQLGPYRFRTNIQKKTLAPIWQEEFKIPICTWDSPNVLYIEVRDKDHFVDDTLGHCCVDINELKDGHRHDMWLPLKNIKVGRLHLAITVPEGSEKGVDEVLDEKTSHKDETHESFASVTANKDSCSSMTSLKSPKVADDFEPIDVEGQKETGIWIHHPGSEVSQTWEPRKGSRRLDTKILGERNNTFGSSDSVSGYINNGESCKEENPEGKKPMDSVRRGIHKIGSVFHRSPRKDEYSDTVGEAVQSPHANIREINSKKTGVKLVMVDNSSGPASVEVAKEEGSLTPDKSDSESPNKMKDMAKSFLKHAENSARSLKHVISRKSSRKSQGNASIIDKTITESNSFDDVSSSHSSDNIIIDNSTCPLNEHILQTQSENKLPVESTGLTNDSMGEPLIDTNVHTEKVNVVQIDFSTDVPSVDFKGPTDVIEPLGSTFSAGDSNSRRSEIMDNEVNKPESPAGNMQGAADLKLPVEKI